jgi:cyclopropane fatty-acyl-phospholipid synthase-like methyltransferase
MKPVTVDDVFDLLDSYITSAALGTAMELGIFWLLAEQPLDTIEIALALEIPTNRCQYWLQLLEHTGLVERNTQGYVNSPTAQAAILDAYSRETWAFLAGEARERFPAMCNLSKHICSSESVWVLQGLTPPNYFKELQEDPEEARRFTRMLYEIHLPLAEEIAAILNMQGVDLMMDLGGGSGVISLALLRRYLSLTSIVVDIPNVCKVGREIARESGMEKRISYYEADFVQDELPAGFDMVLECDAGVYSEEMFRKLWGVLRPNGRLVIVNQFASASGVAPPSYKYWAFLNSMENPEFTLPTVSEVQEQLQKVGFQVFPERALPSHKVWRWSSDWAVIEACKG